MKGRFCVHGMTICPILNAKKKINAMNFIGVMSLLFNRERSKQRISLADSLVLARGMVPSYFTAAISMVSVLRLPRPRRPGLNEYRPGSKATPLKMISHPLPMPWILMIG